MFQLQDVLFGWFLDLESDLLFCRYFGVVCFLVEFGYRWCLLGICAVEFGFSLIFECRRYLLEVVWG